MRFVLGAAMTMLGAATACSSSKGSGPSASSTDGGDDSVCTDTSGSSATAHIDDVFNKNLGLACPLDTNNDPLPYDTAIDVGCTALKMTSGDVEFGQCGSFLVWEVDVDSSGHNLSKCYYDITSHDLVGVLYGDGKKDQCGGKSDTIQAGSLEALCTISGLSAPGAGGIFESCTPVPEGGVRDAGGGG